MRVIVTKLGDEVLRELNQEDDVKKAKREELYKIHKLQELKAQAAQNEDNYNLSMVGQREIKIHQSKLNLPKFQAEKYNMDTKSGVVLPTISITKKTEVGVMSDPEGTNNWANRLNFRVEEVLTDDLLEKLKSKVFNEQKLKQKLAKVDSSNFRSNYAHKDEMEKLEIKLSKEITPDKVNLIKYLNQKDYLSDKFLDKIVNYDEDKTYKLDKVCQIASHKQNDDKIFQNTIKKVIQVHKNKEKVDYKNSITNLGRSVKTSTEVLKKYPKMQINKERYRDIHEEILKQWEKYNAASLQRTKGKKIGLLLHSNNDITANISKLIIPTDIN
jgi:hypothetical protein